MRPTRRRSKTDPMMRSARKVRRKRIEKLGEMRGERKRDMAMGKKRRPSPEISRDLRTERGRIGWVKLWRWRERAMSYSIRRRRIDGDGGGLESMIGKCVESICYFG